MRQDINSHNASNKRTKHGSHGQGHGHISHRSSHLILPDGINDKGQAHRPDHGRREALQTPRNDQRRDRLRKPEDDSRPSKRKQSDQEWKLSRGASISEVTEDGYTLLAHRSHSDQTDGNPRDPKKMPPPNAASMIDIHV